MSSKRSTVSDYTSRPMGDGRVSSVSRRRFLRGFGGVVLGLPFLETFAPRSAQAQAAQAIKRFGVFFACNQRTCPDACASAEVERSEDESKGSIASDESRTRRFTSGNCGFMIASCSRSG